MNVLEKHGKRGRKMRERFARFMQGRYGSRGADELSRFLVYVEFAIIIISFIFRSPIWTWVILALIVYSYYRLFSRNFAKRYEENQKYLAFRNKFRYKCSSFQSELRQRKTHHIYRCPSCRQKIRVPKGKGNIIVTCPKCRTEFQKRS